MVAALGRLLAWPLLALVWLYRLAISPWLGNNCRYDPSCSAYTLQALRDHGAFRGSWMAAKRIGRCHPWGGSGYDPVPSGTDESEPQVDTAPQDCDATLKNRTRVLNHAYGFISRDNRAGGLKYIYECIVDDPNPNTAWNWFFEEMLRWEKDDAVLEFAQQYLRRLLLREQPVAAVKLMLRCRMINEAFRPLADDRDQALLAAQQCRNAELESFLRQR